MIRVQKQNLTRGKNKRTSAMDNDCSTTVPLLPPFDHWSDEDFRGSICNALGVA